MNSREKTIACGAVLAAFFITACDWDWTFETSPHFDSDLQGTWVSNDPAIYSGTLIIEYDRITIGGYGEGQTPPRGNDDNRPFKGFTKGFALKGYSEEGKIFIQDRGELQEGIPYTYWDNDPPYGSPKVKFLSFTFGSRNETLQCE